MAHNDQIKNLENRIAALEKRKPSSSRKGHFSDQKALWQDYGADIISGTRWTDVSF